MSNNLKTTENSFQTNSQQNVSILSINNDELMSECSLEVESVNSEEFDDGSYPEVIKDYLLATKDTSESSQNHPSTDLSNISHGQSNLTQEEIDQALLDESEIESQAVSENSDKLLPIQANTLSYRGSDSNIVFMLFEGHKEQEYTSEIGVDSPLEPSHENLPDGQSEPTNHSQLLNDDIQEQQKEASSEASELSHGIDQMEY